MDYQHRPVLLEPTVCALLDRDFRAQKGRDYSARAGDAVTGVFVDGTFGRGGHSRVLLQRLSHEGRLIVFDKDMAAIRVAQALRAQDERVMPIHAGFGSMAAQLERLGIHSVDGIMLDLGISSPQVDEAARGFSFMREGPLDMRMNAEQGPTAAEWLSVASFDELKEVIARYGEERFAFKIAKAIVSGRESRPLRTTHDLAELVAGAVRTREKGQHPATRTFQAIRIHINQELQELAHALTAVLNLLKTGGRLAVISFHSLEDRMVKQFIAAVSRPAQAYARLPIPEKDMPQATFKSLGKLMADARERDANPRARSAVLRVAERSSVPMTHEQQQAVDRLFRPILVDAPALFAEGR